MKDDKVVALTGLGCANGRVLFLCMYNDRARDSPRLHIKPRHIRLVKLRG